MPAWLEHLLPRLAAVSPDLAVFVIAMLPIVELRGAIPVAIAAFGMPWSKAFLLSVAGNIVPVVPILLLYRPIRRTLSVFGFLRRYFEWTERRAQAKGELVAKYGAIGLSLFVAIPLPMTGAWTGAIAALLFGIKPRWAVPAISLGVVIAGVIVTVMTVGIKALF